MIDLKALYERYASDVFRFALYLSADREEAADITSETFVRAWAAPEPLRMATVKGYLFTIARNLYLHGLRRKRRHVTLDSSLEEVLPDPAAGPLREAEDRAEIRAVLAALQKLPETDRAALLMRAMDGLPYEEIARSLRISLSAAKVKVHRARLALSGAREDIRDDVGNKDRDDRSTHR
jgi:RNA polymerase sigma-70 factor (ECF subfamily)